MANLPTRHEVMSPYFALQQDVCRWVPDHVSEVFSACVNRLEHLVLTRGLSVVLVDLPAYSKLFDKSLSTGYLDLSRLPASLGSWKKGSYLLQPLLERYVYMSDPPGVQPDLSPNLVFLIRTFLLMGKSTVKESPDEATRAEVDAFFNCDKALRSPTCSWTSNWLCSGLGAGTLRFARHEHSAGRDGSRRQRELAVGDRAYAPESLLRLLDAVAGRVVSQFPDFTPLSLVGRHGPGAVADLRSGNDKYTFPNWPEKLGLVFPYSGFAVHRDDLVVEEPKVWSTHEPPARLLAVPKSYEKPRLITSEPTAYQFLQQALMLWMRANLPRPLGLSISFDKQGPSRDLALEASRDGKLVTVDLSSASDRLSLWTVERIFGYHATLLRCLHACRSRWVTDLTMREGRGSSAVLKKYAGQGNATTFTVQSIVYSILCITSILWTEGHRADTRQLTRKIVSAARRHRVFGDDIIIPSSAGLPLTTLLEYLQLKVNWDKTHTRGYFRESCGMDAYKGADVTPLRMQSYRLSEKPTPDELASWIDVSNNAVHKGLWSLASWMDEQIPVKLRKKLVISNRPVSGLRLHTFVNGVRSYGKKVWNSDLQQYEYRCLTVAASTEWSRRDNYDSCHQYFIEAPLPDHKYKSGWVVGKPRLKFRRGRVTCE